MRDLHHLPPTAALPSAPSIDRTTAGATPTARALRVALHPDTLSRAMPRVLRPAPT